MKDISLRDVLEDEFSDVKINAAFSAAVYRYQIEFVNRNREHLNFFGSNLIGVHEIRFRVADLVKFFQDVVKVDYQNLEKRLAEVTTIFQSNPISSDALNITIMYLIHLTYVSTLNEKEKERTMYDLALIFFYRCIAIRQSDYFHFPADPKVAQAAYAQLSNKFLIKKEGTWKKVMEYRAKELIDKESPHYNVFRFFNDDDAVSYAITDGENRIRDMYKNYYVVFHNTYTEGERVGTVSSTMINQEGEESVREKIRSVERYVQFIRQALGDPNSFVKSELTDVILQINTNTSMRMLTLTLNWLSVNYTNPKWHEKIDKFCHDVIVHSFHLLADMGTGEVYDYASMLLTLKNLYLSTRTSNAELLHIRELGSLLVKEANGDVNNSLAMATRTSIILYVTLRALTSKSK